MRPQSVTTGWIRPLEATRAYNAQVPRSSGPASIPNAAPVFAVNVAPPIARILCVLLLAAGWAVAVQAQEPEERVYIVQLREPPAIAAPPEARGAPRNGRFNPRSTATRKYTAALVERHDELLARVGAPPQAKLYSYRLSFNGFAARLTAAQAAELAADPAVARVWLDDTRKLRTNASPAFLGLLDPAAGLRKSLGLQGEDIVIGFIDSGITPGHPSFADTEAGSRPRVCSTEWADSSLLGRWLCRRFRNRFNLVYDPPQDWHGRCESGQEFSAGNCNNKLIGARFYVDGFRATYPMDPNEFISPRDADGHGTHIASVAAGNWVEAGFGGTPVASIAGIAPRARIAVYKACWLQPGATRGTCAMSDLQQAIEDAIDDGVHIINYSVGKTDGSPADPDSLALLAATDAGVLAVVAAGNGGPLARTVESPASAPWVLSVAAASRTGTRFDEALRVTAPAGAAGDFTAREAAFTPTLRSTAAITGELVLADDGNPGVNGADATRDDGCQSLVNAATMEGRVALVRRGGCDFQDKIEHAEAAGALAVVVFSDSDKLVMMAGRRGSVNIPAVMIGRSDGEALAARLDDGETVEVRLEKGLVVSRSDAGNVVTGQSSRGPNGLLPDILKPEVVAPGTDILGAQTTEVANGVRGESYQYLTGTSMAVPHVAGVAALLLEAHPDWSPAAIRSALMTSARQDVRKEDGVTPADAFDAGAGYIVPNAAVEPGLVFDAGREDYEAFACGVGIPIATLDEEYCARLEAAGYPATTTDLNLPSAALADLVTTRVMRRAVRNVGEPARYQATVVAPPGVGVSVIPEMLSLDRGETAEFTITATNLGTSDRLGQWGFGSLTWSTAGTKVRMPLAIRTEALAAPPVVVGTGASGSLRMPVEFGYAGAFSARVEGLVAPQVYTGFVTDDPLDLYTVLADDGALPDHVRRFRITLPAGGRFLRIALAGSDEGATDDIDLYVICPSGVCPDGSTVLSSTTTGAVEFVDILDPAAGEYVIDVHGFKPDNDAGGPGANFELGIWLIRGPGKGSPEVTTPATAAVGASAEVQLDWAGLELDLPHLGMVVFSDGEREIGDTLVEIYVD